MSWNCWRLTAASLALFTATTLVRAQFTTPIVCPPVLNLQVRPTAPLAPKTELLPMPREISPYNKFTCYPVADLIVPLPGPGEKESILGATVTHEDLLIKLIQRFVASNTWVDQGGVGVIDFHPMTMSLVVRQTPAVHEQIEAFLTMLRAFQPREFVVEMRFGKGCSGPEDVTHLPKLTLFDGQTSRICCRINKPTEQNAICKGDFAVEVHVQTLEKKKLGLCLDVQVGKGDKKVERLQAVREIKEGEAIKLRLGVPAKGEPQEWVEVLVNGLQDAPQTMAKESPIAPTPFPPLPYEKATTDNVSGMTLPQPRYLEHPPQYIPESPIPLPREVASTTAPQAVPPLRSSSSTGVVQAKHVVKEQIPTKAKAATTLRLHGGEEMSIRTVGSRIVVKTRSVEGSAEHVTVDAPNGYIELEGNVRMRSLEDGSRCYMHSTRIRITSDGNLEVIPPPASSTPSSYGGANSFPITPTASH
jgi:hypothetical protein